MATYLPALIFFLLFYTIVAPFYESPKKRSWILTATASTFLSTSCVPFVFAFVKSRATMTEMAGSVPLSRIFQAYLTADLIMGSRHYPEHVSLVLGWVHHLVYIAIVEFCVYAKYTHIFATALLMEFPTSLLAWGSLHPTILRNTIFFAVAFFMTRILSHLILIGLYTLPQGNGRRAVGGSLVPASLFIAAFPMHCIWFTGCLKGFIRRAKARKEAAAVAPTTAPPAPIEEPIAVAQQSTPESTATSIPELRRITLLRRRIPPHQLQAMKQHVRALARYLEETARRTSPTREEIFDFVRERSRPLRRAIAAY